MKYRWKTLVEETYLKAARTGLLFKMVALANIVHLLAQQHQNQNYN